MTTPPPDSVDLRRWAEDLCTALDLPLGAAHHVGAVLDVTRDAAHALNRPAAPVAAFLVGVAAGRQGVTDEAVADACRKASELAATHGERS